MLIIASREEALRISRRPASASNAKRGRSFDIGRAADQISAFDTLAFDCLEHVSHRFRHPVGVRELQQCQNQVPRSVATLGLAVVCANEQAQESPMRKSVLATREKITTNCVNSTVANAVDVRRSNVLARSRALLVKRDALFAISTSRTRRFLSLASQCLRLHRSMVVIVLKS